MSGIFEEFYASAEAGGARPPWDYGAPRPQLVEWAETRDLAGSGRVVSQKPAAGSLVEKGTRISVELAGHLPTTAR